MPDSTIAPEATRVHTGGLIGLVTVAMTSATLLPVAIGALGPFVVEDLALSRPQLGILVTASFVVASGASLFMGRLADSSDERRLLPFLFILAGSVLLASSFAPSYGTLLIPFGLAGLCLAAANPVTNKLVSAHIPPSMQGLTMGIKQSGVTVGILAAGLVLPQVALAFGWQRAMRFAAVIPLAAGVISLPLLPRGPAPTRPARNFRIHFPPGLVRWLLFFAFFMGGGVASTHTFLPLFAHETLGFPENVAGLTLSTIGFTGIFARILWTHLANRPGRLGKALAGIAGASVISSIAFLSAPTIGSGAVWFGAVLQGSSAVAWAPIAMLAVLQNVGYDETGHASSMVNFGFFAGFILSPPGFGFLVESTGTYTAGWLMVATQFLAAIGVLVVWRAARASSITRRTT